MIADIHCHLDHPRFKGEIDNVVENAKKAGVVSILTSGVDPNTNRKVLELAEKYKPIVKASLGIFPAGALDREVGKGNEEEYGVSKSFDYDEELRFIEESKDKIISIGECGLDYDGIDDMPEAEKEKYKAKQKEVFMKIIELAKKIDKPIIVHSRKAELDCVEILEKSGLKKSKIVMHCFGGKLKLAIRIAQNGWYLSIPPKIARLQQFQDIVKNVPLGNLLTETDAPYQSPEPMQRNEPAFIKAGIKKIAEIKGITEEDAENNLFMNYQRVFL